MAKKRRGQKFIDAKIQGALVRRLLLHWFAFLVICCGVTFLLQVLLDPLASASEHLRKVQTTAGPFVVVSILMLPIFVLDSIKLSHRFVGPIVRLRRAIQQIGVEEEVQPIKLRSNDFWREVVSEFNAMLNRTNISSATIASSAEVAPVAEAEVEA